MSPFVLHFIRNVSLPSLALVLGVLAQTPPMGIDDGACRHFEGPSGATDPAQLNDPKALVVLSLCRQGDSLQGVLKWSGESGKSITALSGQVDGEGVIHLRDESILMNQPSPGWAFCFDDVYRLKWSTHQDALVGEYRSATCRDRGMLVLSPLLH